VKLHYHWSGLLPQLCLAEVPTPLPHAIPCNVANRTKCKREHCGCVQVGNIRYHTEDHGSRSGEEPSVLGLVDATTVLDVPVYITTCASLFHVETGTFRYASQLRVPVSRGNRDVPVYIATARPCFTWKPGRSGIHCNCASLFHVETGTFRYTSQLRVPVSRGTPVTQPCKSARDVPQAHFRVSCVSTHIIIVWAHSLLNDVSSCYSIRKCHTNQRISELTSSSNVHKILATAACL
jgi:hypothetical protein